jgi:hypothetical protein
MLPPAINRHQHEAAAMPTGPVVSNLGVGHLDQWIASTRGERRDSLSSRLPWSSAVDGEPSVISQGRASTNLQNSFGLQTLADHSIDNGNLFGVELTRFDGQGR